jgi:hypothetical protein
MAETEQAAPAHVQLDAGAMRKLRRKRTLRRAARQPNAATAQDEHHDVRQDEPRHHLIPRHRRLPSTARALKCSPTPSPTQARVALVCHPAGKVSVCGRDEGGREERQHTQGRLPLLTLGSLTLGHRERHDAGIPGRAGCGKAACPDLLGRSRMAKLRDNSRPAAGRSVCCGCSRKRGRKCRLHPHCRPVPGMRG